MGDNRIKSSLNKCDRVMSAEQKEKDDDNHLCAFCSRRGRATRLIFHSVVRITDVGFREYFLDRFGFGMYICDGCDRTHKLLYLLYYTLHIVCIVGGLVVPYLLGRYAYPEDSIFWTFVSVGVSIFTLAVPLRVMRKRDPWRMMAKRHTVVADLLKAGYKFDDEDDRPVEEGQDTTNRRRTRQRKFFTPLKRGRAYDDESSCDGDGPYATLYMEHETYSWMGVLTNFSYFGEIEPQVADALEFMCRSEKGRPPSLSFKEVFMQYWAPGIFLAPVFIAISSFFMYLKFMKR